MAPRHRDSRARILKAASAEFAVLGYGATRVDRIARRARLNKAMVYYHFGSKLGLYRAILLDMVGAVTSRLDDLVGQPLDPAAKIRRVVDIYVEAAGERPHIPPMMLREAANKGRLFNKDTARAVAGLWQRLGAVIDQGVEAGTFAPVNPLMVHLAIVAPLMFFLAINPEQAPLLKRLGPAVVAPTRGELVAHIQNSVVAMLETAPRPRAQKRGRDAR